MEQYLHRGALSGLLNALGLRVLIAVGAVGWFVWLWGVGMPALLAGLALGVLGQLAMTRGRARYAERREDAVRARLGGELALEELALCPPREAHAQAARLLAMRYPLTLRHAEADGALCLYAPKGHEAELLLVVCAARPRDAALSSGDVAPVMRACRARGAQRGVLCLTCATSARVESEAAAGPVPVRVVRREVLLQLAGHAAPATDEQLMALKARRRRIARVDSVAQRVLHPAKARRYMGYGIGLMLLFVLTGARALPVPAAVCLGLGAACRCRWARGAGQEEL